MFGNLVQKVAQSFSLCSSLIIHAAEGNLELVRQLLEKGADVNAGKYGTTPLLAAIGCNQTDVTMELIRRGADVNLADKNGATPLIGAIYEKKTDVAMELIGRGADVNLADKNGITPLIGAICKEETDVAMELIRRGADVNLVNKWGDTPLLAAIGSNQTDVTMELIRRGVDVNVENKYGDNPLLYAIRTKKTDVVMELIRRGADVNLANKNGMTPLLVAINEEKTDVAMELIRRGVDVNVENKYGDTPLLYAIRTKKTDVVMELIGRRADVNLANKKGRTPLIGALESGNLIVVRKILEQEINLDMRDRKNYLKVVRSLLRSKVDNPEDFKILSHGEKLECFNIMCILGYLAMFTSIPVLRKNLSTPKAICFLDAFDKKLYSLLLKEAEVVILKFPWIRRVKDGQYKRESGGPFALKIAKYLDAEDIIGFLGIVEMKDRKSLVRVVMEKFASEWEIERDMADLHISKRAEEGAVALSSYFDQMNMRASESVGRADHLPDSRLGDVNVHGLGTSRQNY